MPNLGFQELLIIFLIVLILFGAKKIPDIAQGLGRGIRDFKRSMKETTDEISKATQADDDGSKAKSSEKNN